MGIVVYQWEQRKIFKAVLKKSEQKPISIESWKKNLEDTIAYSWSGEEVRTENDSQELPARVIERLARLEVFDRSWLQTWIELLRELYWLQTANVGVCSQMVFKCHKRHTELLGVNRDAIQLFGSCFNFWKNKNSIPTPNHDLCSYTITAYNYFLN